MIGDSNPIASGYQAYIVGSIEDYLVDPGGALKDFAAESAGVWVTLENDDFCSSQIYDTTIFYADVTSVSSCSAVDPLSSVSYSALTGSEVTLDFTSSLEIGDLDFSQLLDEAECSSGDPTIVSTAPGSGNSVISTQCFMYGNAGFLSFDPN